jgi:hypothetical protein
MKPQAKTKVKAKGKKKSSQKKIDREIDRQLSELDEKVDELYKYAKPIYDAQHRSVREAIQRMIEQMKHMTGSPNAVIYIDGDPVRVNIEEGIQEKSFLYIAVRLLVYASRLDVRVGKFELLPKSCAECGKKVK